MKVLNIHLKNYDSQYDGRDLMSLEEVVLCMKGKHVTFSTKVFGINKELQPHFSEDTVEVRIELKEKGSIFDNPRWVTFDKSKDLMGCFLDTLVDGKDYKVIETKVLTTGDKTYLLENGVRAHESYFHKVKPQDLLPEEVEESFDKLVYIEPKSSNTSQYFSLKRSCCSEDQWNYAIKCLGNPPDCLGNNKTIQWCCDDKKWFDDAGWDDDTIVSFNDIFQEVD